MSQLTPESASGPVRGEVEWNDLLNDIDQVRRFLCLGSERGLYVVMDLHKDPVILVPECITRLVDAGRGKEVVEEIVSFSVDGRAAKYDNVVAALAMCARSGDQATKQAAYGVLNRVCRIPTHLFQFIEFCEKLSSDGSSGWGRAHRKAICNWYQHFGDAPLQLARLVTKYRKRNKWSHKDVLRLAHLKPNSAGVGLVAQYVMRGLMAAKKACSVHEDTSVDIKKTLSFLEAVEEVKSLTGSGPDDVNQVCDAIRTHQLVREHVPTQLLKSAEVWKALLVNMPLNALLRNLGKLTSLNMLDTDSEAANNVIKKLDNGKALQNAHVHPFNVLMTLAMYKRGCGDVGNLRWQPNERIMTALDKAFYESIKYVEPTGKRILLAIDVGISMTVPVIGTNAINARQAAAALAMVTARREQHCEIVGFSDTLQPIDIHQDATLHEVMDTIDAIPAGRTDCAAAMQWARREDKKFDVFVVLTDCRTEPGRESAVDALREYRVHSGISRAKLVVVAFASNGFTLADPRDPDMLDVAGFDGNGPAVINTFITAM